MVLESKSELPEVFEVEDLFYDGISPRILEVAIHCPIQIQLIISLLFVDLDNINKGVFLYNNVQLCTISIEQLLINQDEY